MKSFQLRAACAAWLLAAAAGLTLPTRAAAQLQLEVRAGFSETLVPGRWAPVELALYNAGSARRGEAFLRVPATGSAPSLEYVERVEMPHQGRRTALFALPLAPGMSGLVAGMRDEAGRTVVEQDIDLSAHSSAEALVLALSRGSDLEFLPALRRRKTAVAYVRAEQLPARWAGLDSVHALVVHNIPLSEVEQTRYEALLTWVRNGGALVLAAGSSFSVLQGPRERELLPVRVRGLAHVRGIPALPGFPGKPLPEGEWPVLDAAPDRGEVLVEAEGRPLVARRKLGLGSVTFLAIDYATPRLTAWPGNSALWDLVLATGQDGPPADTGSTEWAYTGAPHPAAALLGQPLLRAPARLGLAAYVLVYVLLAAGALWAIRASWGRGVAGWAALGVIVPACVIGAAVWMREPILQAGGAVLSLKTQRLHAEEESGRLVEHSAVISSRGALANLLFKEPTTVVRVTQPLAAPAEAASPAAVRVSREGDTIIWRGLRLPRRSGTVLTTESWAAAPVVLRVTPQGGTTVLALENRGARPVVSSLVLVGGALYETGSLRPGEKHEEDFFDTSGKPSDATATLADWVSARLPERIGKLGPEIPRLLLRDYFRDRKVADAAGKLIWLGWVPDDEPGVRLEGGSSFGMALTLLVAEVEP